MSQLRETEGWSVRKEENQEKAVFWKPNEKMF